MAVSDITNPFYFGIIRGAERAAATADFTLMVGDAHESAEAERRMLNRHLPLVDGMVITSSRLSDQELRSLARRVPVVVLNRKVTGLPCVVPDNARGIRRAVEHLGALGHSRIGYLAGPEASWADGMRWRAVRESTLELGLEDVRIGPIHPTVAGGRGAARRVMEQQLSAVICYNDLLAVGVLRGIADLGARVPEDVSVIGFDNTQAAELVGLTTIASPSVLLGETAVLYMVGLVKGTTQSRDALSVLPVRLVTRQSTAPRR
nr:MULTISPECIES: substrate-binding domain-containing protein [unclassified Ornithinimicrobium]